MSKYFSYSDNDILIQYKKDCVPIPSYFKMHTHETYELYFFESGSGIYRVEGTPYHLEPGDILILRPSEAHYIDILDRKPYSRFSINFKAELLNDIDPEHTLLRAFNNRKIGTYNLYRAENFKTDTYRAYIKNLISESANRRVHTITNLLPLLNEISIAFSMISENELNSTLDCRIINYINRHISENILLDDICERYYISKSHLCRIFKKATASTIVEYITVKRLVMARQLILSGVPPTKAYLQCGFKDYSSFYRTYKKKYGVSPSKH